MMLVTGFGMMAQMAASNTILQTIVEDHMRGRVMSFFGMAFMGMLPFGSLLAGALAARIGPSTTVALCGAATILAGAIFAFKLPTLRRLIRPIYVEKGIITEIAAGLGTASELEAPEVQR